MNVIMRLLAILLQPKIVHLNNRHLGRYSCDNVKSSLNCSGPGSMDDVVRVIQELFKKRPSVGPVTFENFLFPEWLAQA